MPIFPCEFDVLKRDQHILDKMLLEASAGTGKTFSIEHLFVRLIVEKKRSVEEILVVTFTNAATDELSNRILATLKKAKEEVIYGKSSTDYLQGIIESSDRREAKLALQRAVDNFDEASIYTIHKFCSKVVQEEDNIISMKEVQGVVRTYLQSVLSSDEVTPEMMQIVLRRHRFDIEDLEKKLSDILFRGIKVQKVDRFLGTLKKVFIDPEEVKLFNKTTLKSGELKSFVLKAIDAETFDEFIKYKQVFLEFLSEDNLKKKAPYVPRKLLDDLKPFQEVLSKASSYLHILAILAQGCEKLLKLYMERENKAFFDTSIEKMEALSKDPLFCRRIGEKYKAAIIDEFQDTDFKQWNIFCRLFLDKGSLYLVGDPKQSIYRFRLADVYTYLQAKEAMGESCIFYLRSNYRSCASLVGALNFLFEKADKKELFSLPKKQTFIPYLPVKAAKAVSGGCIHFIIGKREKNQSLQEMEQEIFFPAIIEEIINCGLPFNSWAILVKDRFQADRFSEALKKCNIPFALQREQDLTESYAYRFLMDFIEALKHIKNKSLVRKFLFQCATDSNSRWLPNSGCIAEASSSDRSSSIALAMDLSRSGASALCNTAIDWVASGNCCATEDICALHQLSLMFFKKGFLVAFQGFLKSSLVPKDPSFRLQLIQAADSFIEEKDKEETFSSEGVQILTMHKSKGLEFDRVVPLGLMHATSLREDFIAFERQGQREQVIFEEMSDQEQAFFLQDMEAEKLRQLYVTLTRAKKRLVWPVVEREESFSNSPADLFFQKILEPGETISSFLENKPGIVVHIASKRLIPQPFQKQDVKVDCVNMAPIASKKFIHSFSSLAQPESPQFLKEAPHDFLAEVKNPFTLPSGAYTGTFLHTLFEKVSFQEELLPFVQRMTASTPFVGWEKTLVEMMSQALNTPFAPLGGATLSNIFPNFLFKETEFLFPVDAFDRSLNKDSFFRGFIDLCFEWEGKVYVLDWKSNWLGKNPSDYEGEALLKAMKDHCYDLQAKIYKEAVQRYISLFDHLTFGGVIYLFVRCIDKDRGVFIC